jgi:hypothetical protein
MALLADLGALLDHVGERGLPLTDTGRLRLADVRAINARPAARDEGRGRAQPSDDPSAFGHDDLLTGLHTPQELAERCPELRHVPGVRWVRRRMAESRSERRKEDGPAAR